MYWRLLRIMLGAFFILLAVNVFFPQEDDKPKAENARTVTIYASLPAENLQEIASEFEKASGIKVLYVPLASQDVLTRIRAERTQPQVDIWLGAGVENLVQAKKEGLLQSHISEPVSVIPVKWRDQDGYWLGMYLDVPVFVTNKDLFTRQQTDLPHTWEDLLKPQYKYKIALADPGVSNATLAMFAAIQQQLGQVQAFAYFAKLQQNIQHYPKEAAMPGRLVALGEMSVGVLGANDAFKYMRQGFPLIVTFAEEDMGYYLYGAGMIAGAPHGAEAGIFMDWLAKEGQSCLLSNGLYYYPTNPEVKPPPELLFFKDLDIAAFNVIGAVENKTAFIEKWNTEIRFGIKQ